MQELYSANPVMFKNNPLGFILALLLVPVGVGIIIFLVWHLRNKSSRLVVTDSHVLYEKGLLSKERSEIDIDSIPAVKVSQAMFKRIFCTGTVDLYTAGDSAEFYSRCMPDANRVREIIKANQRK